MDEVYSLFEQNSFGEQFPGVDVLREENLFLPCLRYNILIPSGPQKLRQLDLFEEITLRALVRGNQPSAERLAQLFCLPEDLIQAVQRRLYLKDLLDENFHPTEQAEKVLGSVSSMQDIPCKTRPAVLLRLYSGEWLPLVLPDGGQDVSFSREDNTLQMHCGSSVGNKITVSGRRLNFKKPEKGQKRTQEKMLPPEQKDVQKILWDFMQNFPRKYDLAMRRGQRVDVSQQPGRAYLHVKCVLQNGNVDTVLCSDGMTPNNHTLADYLKKEYPEQLAGLRRLGGSADVTGENRQNRKASSRPQPYPQLQKKWPAAASVGSTPDDARQAGADNRDAVGNLMGAFEWALYYYLRSIPQETLAEALRLLETSGVNEDNRIVLNDAAKLGWMDRKPAGCLKRRFRSIEARSIISGQKPPLLEPLLQLAVVVVAGGQHMEVRMQNAACLCPDLPAKLDELHLCANSSRHTDSGAQMDLKQQAEITGVLRRVICTLLPDCALDEESGPQMIENSSQARLNASLQLEKELGFPPEQLLGSVREPLLRVCGKQAPEPDIRFVLDLCRALEAEMYAILQRTGLEQAPPDNKEAVQLVCRELGVDSLPEGIAGVANHYYQDAAHHRRATLGAYALTLLCSIPTDGLKQLNEVRFMEKISELAWVRGHGNRLDDDLTTEKMEQLRSNTLEIIQILEQYFRI